MFQPLPQYSYQSVLNQRAATPRFSAFPLLVIAPQQPLTAQDYCESADIRSNPLKGERSDNQIRRYQLTRRLYCTLNLKENQTIYQRPPLNLYVLHKFASNVFLAKACENLVIRQPDNLLVGILPNPYRSSLRDGCAFLRNTKKERPGQQCNDCCPGRSVICGQCVCSSLRCTCSSSFCSAS